MNKISKKKILALILLFVLCLDLISTLESEYDLSNFPTFDEFITKFNKNYTAEEKI
jgi:hypothetical protein